MKLEERLSRFQEAVNRQVDKQIETFHEALKEKRKHSFEQAENKVFAQCYTLIQNEILNIKNNNSRFISETEQVLKRELFLQRRELIDACFNQLTNKLIAFLNTPDYAQMLQQDFQQAKDVFLDMKGAVLYGRKEDQSIFDCSELEFVETNYPLGGFCLKRGHLFVDCTVEYKLKKAREEFVNRFSLSV